MSEPSPQPDWKRLPHDPAGFFGLRGEFDRKDLKRAYNSLLRVYKPEKYPQEFQQIRAAFEQLDERLRYGGTTTAPELAAGGEWPSEGSPTDAPREPAFSHEGPESPRSKGAGPSRPDSLIDQLDTADPAALYSELKQKPEKSPFDFYALAVMSDVVERQPQGFIEWILRGLTAHRRSGPLLNLLSAYLRGPQPPAALAKLLPVIAKVVKDDTFFAITEAAWHVLLKELEFQQFLALLDRCKREIRDAQLTCYMVFMINILRSAMWRAPFEWSQQQMIYLNENFEQIPPWLEGDVDLLGAIAEYLTVRDQFIQAHPLRAEIDRAMRDYFCEPQPQADRSVVDCHLRLLADQEGLLDALRMEECDLYTKFYPIWSWMSHDVAERQGQPEVEEIDEQVWVNRAQALLERCVTMGQRSAICQLWTLMKLTVGLIVVMIVVALLGLLGVTFGLISPKLGNGAGWAICFVLAGVAAAALYWIWPKIHQRWWIPIREKMTRRCYEKVWRREVLAFQRRSHLPDRYFRALFEHFAAINDHTQWINYFVQQDYAPATVALAQRFEF